MSGIIEATDFKEIFFPRKNSGVTLLEGTTTVTIKGRINVYVRRFRPPKDEKITTRRPLVIFFHGNGELAESYSCREAIVPGIPPNMMQILFDHCACDAAFVEYRGYGDHFGSEEPSLSGCLEDSLEVIPGLGVDPRDCVVFGRSLGSLFALHVAAAQRPACVVIESGIATLESVSARGASGKTVEAIRSADANLLKQTEKVSDFVSHGGKLLVIHAVDDAIVPISNAESLVASATAAVQEETKGSVEFVKMKIGGHNMILPANWECYRDRLRSFLSAKFNVTAAIREQLQFSKTDDQTSSDKKCSIV